MKLVTCKGGHGWVPNTYYCDRIKEGILWLMSTAAHKPLQWTFRKVAQLRPDPNSGKSKTGG